MTKQEDKVPVVFIDSPHAPEVYATDAAGFFHNLGNIHISFVSTRVNHGSNPGRIANVVIGRLVMPVKGAQALMLGLYNFLKQQGLDPLPPVPDKNKLQ